MRSGHRLLAILAALVVFFGIVAIPAGRSQAPDLDETFETFDDPAMEGWQLVGETRVADGSLRISDGGRADRAGTWGDIDLVVTARRSGAGQLGVGYRTGASGGYEVWVEAGIIVLLRTGAVLAEAPLPPRPEDETFTLRVVATDDAHEVFVNGGSVLMATDADPLPPGGLALFSRGGAVSEFDDLTLVAASAPTVTTDPTAEATMAPTAGESRSVDLTIEDVVRLEEDMENGLFDGMAPMVDSGSYQVTDDGTGNLAARLRGTGRLVLRPNAWQAWTWEDYDLRARLRARGTVAVGVRYLPAHPDAPNLASRGYWLERDQDGWSLLHDVGGSISLLTSVEHRVSESDWFDFAVGIQTTDEGAQLTVQVDGETLLEYTIVNDPEPFGGIAFRASDADAELWIDDVEVIDNVDTRYTWSQTGGPRGGHDVAALAVDPRDSQVVYLGGLDSDLYKTTDGGELWTAIGLPNELWTNRIHTIELAPTDPDIIYVGAGGKHVGTVWRSDDAGATWHGIDLSTTEPERADYLAEGDTLGVAVDPADTMHIFFSIGSGLGVVPPEYAGIYESMDGGATFTQRLVGTDIGAIEIDPADRTHLLATNVDRSREDVAIYSSSDTGRTWERSDAGIDEDAITAVLFDPTNPGTVFAVAHTLAPELGANVYRSTDGGVTWDAVPGLPRANRILATHESDPVLVAHHPDGVSTSTDGGDTWTLTGDPSCSAGKAALGTDDPRVMYSAVSPDILRSDDLGATCLATTGDGLLAHAVLGLGIAPSDPGVVYVGTTAGVFRSVDYGATWDFLRDGLYAGIAVDPTDPDTVYLGGVETPGVLTSTDGGQTWRQIAEAIEFPGVGDLAIVPDNPDVLFAGTGHGPQFGSGGAGLYRSADGGTTWARADDVPEGAVTSIAISADNTDRVVVSVMGSGVFVSDDGGETFIARNTGLTVGPDGAPVLPNVWAVAIDPRDGDVLYAGTVEHVGYGAEGGFPGVYKSVDGGQTWELLLGNRTPGPYEFLYFGAGVDALAVNPANPDEVYVALHDPGVIVSENGGRDWRFANDGIVPVLTHLYPYAMVMSPDGRVLYATSCGRSVYRNLLDRPEDAAATPAPTGTAATPAPTGAAATPAPTGAAATPAPIGDSGGTSVGIVIAVGIVLSLLAAVTMIVLLRRGASRRQVP